MKIRWSSPQQVSRGHLWQNVEMQDIEQFKLSASTWLNNIVITILKRKIECSRVTISLTSKCKIAREIATLGLSGKDFYVLIQARLSFNNVVVQLIKRDLTYPSFIFESKNLKQEVCDPAKNKNLQ